MKEIEIVAYAFHQFANLSVDDFKLALLYWKHK